MILEPPKNKVWHCFHIYFPWSDGTRCHHFITKGLFATVLFTENIMFVCELCPFSCIQLFSTLWTVARPLPMGFSRQEYWSGSPCPPTGYLLNSGIEPMSFMSSALADGFFTISANGEAHIMSSYQEKLQGIHTKRKGVQFEETREKAFVFCFCYLVLCSWFLFYCFSAIVFYWTFYMIPFFFFFYLAYQSHSKTFSVVILEFAICIYN